MVVSLIARYATVHLAYLHDGFVISAASRLRDCKHALLILNPIKGGFLSMLPKTSRKLPAYEVVLSSNTKLSHFRQRGCPPPRNLLTVGSTPHEQ